MLGEKKDLLRIQMRVDQKEVSSVLDVNGLVFLRETVDGFGGEVPDGAGSDVGESGCDIGGSGGGGGGEDDACGPRAAKSGRNCRSIEPIPTIPEALTANINDGSRGEPRQNEITTRTSRFHVGGLRLSRLHCLELQKIRSSFGTHRVERRDINRKVYTQGCISEGVEVGLEAASHVGSMCEQKARLPE